MVNNIFKWTDASPH